MYLSIKLRAGQQRIEYNKNSQKKENVYDEATPNSLINKITNIKLQMILQPETTVVITGSHCIYPECNKLAIPIKRAIKTGETNSLRVSGGLTSFLD